MPLYRGGVLLSELLARGAHYLTPTKKTNLCVIYRSKTGTAVVKVADQQVGLVAWGAQMVRKVRSRREKQTSTAYLPRDDSKDRTYEITTDLKSSANTRTQVVCRAELYART